VKSTTILLLIKLVLTPVVGLALETSETAASSSELLTEIEKQSEELSELEAEFKALSKSYLGRVGDETEIGVPIAALVMDEEANIPASAILALRAADLLYRNGRFKTALTRYQHAASQSEDADDMSWALFQIANCQLHLRDRSKAIETYNKLIARYPKNEWAEEAEWMLKHAEWECRWAKSTGVEDKSSEDANDAGQ